MGDFTSTSFSSSCTCPLIRLQPRVAFKHIAHFMPCQKSYHGSYTRHLDFTRTSARPRDHLKRVPINLIALGLATGEFQVGYEEEEMAEGLLLQPASGGDEETEEAQDASSTETSLVLATRAIVGTLAGANYASEVARHVCGDATDTPAASSEIIIQAQKERIMRRKTQQLTYLFAALASSVGITSLAGASVYCRFAWQMQGGGDVPWTEMCGTFSLALGAAVGMEYWARWAHRVLWHASLWSMHEELEEVGGRMELEKVLQKRKRENRNPIIG